MFVPTCVCIVRPDIIALHVRPVTVIFAVVFHVHIENLNAFAILSVCKHSQPQRLRSIWHCKAWYNMTLIAYYDVAFPFNGSFSGI